LVQRLHSPKNMSDRNKDPQDFFAHPVYFFRNNKTHVDKFRSSDKGLSRISTAKLKRRTIHRLE
jgi:hypothetical protein